MFTQEILLLVKIGSKIETLCKTQKVPRGRALYNSALPIPTKLSFVIGAEDELIFVASHSVFCANLNGIDCLSQQNLKHFCTNF